MVRRTYNDDLVREQISGLQRADDDLKTAFGALETRVFAGLHDLGEKFSRGNDLIHRRLDERSQTPWATLSGFATLILLGMSSVGYLARQPLADGIMRNREDFVVETALRRHEDERIRDALQKALNDLAFVRGQLDVATRAGRPQ